MPQFCPTKNILLSLHFFCMEKKKTAMTTPKVKNIIDNLFPFHDIKENLLLVLSLQFIISLSYTQLRA